MMHEENNFKKIALAKIAMKNILPFMTSVIVTLLATEIPSYMDAANNENGTFDIYADSTVIGKDCKAGRPYAVLYFKTVFIKIVINNVSDKFTFLFYRINQRIGTESGRQKESLGFLFRIRFFEKLHDQWV